MPNYTIYTDDLATEVVDAIKTGDKHIVFILNKNMSVAAFAITLAKRCKEEGIKIEKQGQNFQFSYRDKSSMLTFVSTIFWNVSKNLYKKQYGQKLVIVDVRKNAGEKKNRRGYYPVTGRRSYTPPSMKIIGTITGRDVTGATATIEVDKNKNGLNSQIAIEDDIRQMHVQQAKHDQERLLEIFRKMAEGIPIQPREGQTYADCHQVLNAVYMGEQMVICLVPKIDDAQHIAVILVDLLKSKGYELKQLTTVSGQCGETNVKFVTYEDYEKHTWPDHTVVEFKRNSYIRTDLNYEAIHNIEKLIRNRAKLIVVILPPFSSSILDDVNYVKETLLRVHNRVLKRIGKDHQYLSFNSHIIFTQPINRENDVRNFSYWVEVDLTLNGWRFYLENNHG